MTEHTEPYNRDTALILKERGLSGLEIILTNQDAPDTDEGINAVLDNPANILAGYLIKPEHVMGVVAELLRFSAKYEAYKYYARVYQGCDDPEVLAAVVKKHLRFQSQQFTDSQPEGDRYYVGGNMVLFTLVDTSNEAAKHEIIDRWRHMYGELAPWELTAEMVGDKVYFSTRNLQSAKKFYTWLYQEFIGPTLRIVQDIT